MGSGTAAREAGRRTKRLEADKVLYIITVARAGQGRLWRIESVFCLTVIL